MAAGYPRNQELEGLEGFGRPGKETSRPKKHGKPTGLGCHKLRGALVPSPAPRPQLTEETLCVLVRGAALGRQSSRGPESGMPGPALAFTNSSRGTFNKLHEPDLCVHQHAVGAALPSPQGLFNQV